MELVLIQELQLGLSNSFEEVYDGPFVKIFGFDELP
jgi:hypothetical protein